MNWLKSATAFYLCSIVSKADQLIEHSCHKTTKTHQHLHYSFVVTLPEHSCIAARFEHPRKYI